MLLSISTNIIRINSSSNSAICIYIYIYTDTHTYMCIAITCVSTLYYYNVLCYILQRVIWYYIISYCTMLHCSGAWQVLPSPQRFMRAFETAMSCISTLIYVLALCVVCFCAYYWQQFVYCFVMCVSMCGLCCLLCLLFIYHVYIYIYICVMSCVSTWNNNERACKDILRRLVSTFPSCLSLWGPLGDTPPIRNKTFLGPCRDPKGTNSQGHLGQRSLSVPTRHISII